MKWVLIPGLGIDERYFANIVDLLPDLQILQFPVPDGDETIEHYAGRLRSSITGSEPLVLGGVSFGGMLASIMCAQVQPAALVLMSSTPHPAALGGSLRLFEWMSRLYPARFAAWLMGLTQRSMRWVEPISPEKAREFRDITQDSDLRLVRRGARMIMQWRTEPQITCPYFHLHGTRDALIPGRRVQPTHLVDGAGHLLNLTHEQELRDFIHTVRQQVGSGG